MFGGGFFGGGEKRSTVTTTSTSFASDLRTAVEGGLGGGTLIGPKATVGASGSVTTSLGDYSTLTQQISGNKFKVGMSGQEVKDLLIQQADLSGQSLQSVADFGTAALNAVATGQAEYGSTAAIGKVLPWLAIGVVVVLAFRNRRR